MSIVTEQERAGWVNPWPEDGEQCPDCRHGQLEVQQFGQGVGQELHAWCVGLNGISQDEADEDEAEQAGCGWSGRQRTVGYVRGDAMCQDKKQLTKIPLHDAGRSDAECIHARKPIASNSGMARTHSAVPAINCQTWRGLILVKRRMTPGSFLPSPP